MEPEEEPAPAAKNPGRDRSRGLPLVVALRKKARGGATRKEGTEFSWTFFFRASSVGLVENKLAISIERVPGRQFGQFKCKNK